MRNLNGATVTCQAQNEIGMTSSKTQLDIKCEYHEISSTFLFEKMSKFWSKIVKKSKNMKEHVIFLNRLYDFILFSKL